MALVNHVSDRWAPLAGGPWHGGGRTGLTAVRSAVSCCEDGAVPLSRTKSSSFGQRAMATGGGGGPSRGRTGGGGPSRGRSGGDGDGVGRGGGDAGWWDAELSPPRLRAATPPRPASKKAWTSAGTTSSFEDPMSHYLSESG